MPSSCSREPSTVSECLKPRYPDNWMVAEIPSLVIPVRGRFYGVSRTPLPTGVGPVLTARFCITSGVHEFGKLRVRHGISPYRESLDVNFVHRQLQRGQVYALTLGRVTHRDFAAWNWIDSRDCDGYVRSWISEPSQDSTCSCPELNVGGHALTNRKQALCESTCQFLTQRPDDLPLNAGFTNCF